MREQLQYYQHQPELQRVMGADILTRPNEIHELATDIQHIGSIALFSEAQATHAVGMPTEINVPNPLTSFRKGRRPLSSFYGEGKTEHGQIRAALFNANASLQDLQASLNSYPLGPDEPVDLINSGTATLREANDTRELILAGSPMAPFILTSKDLTATAKGKSPGTYSWHEWFNDANGEQLTNFSQLYTERLKTLADPEAKARFIEDLKTDYKQLVNKAVQDGWIDDQQLTTLDKVIDPAEIRFFSPFGDMSEHFGGTVQERSGSALVLLPTIVGPNITIHELGHIFAGISARNMYAYFQDKLGKHRIESGYLLAEYELAEILNEGFDDHMTEALVNGAPMIISPAERLKQGIPELKGGSEPYSHYREVLGAIVGGDEGALSLADMKQIVGCMAKRDFKSFADFVTQKWHGRDVLIGALEVVKQHANDKLLSENADNPAYDALLADKILDYLHLARTGVLQQPIN